MAKIKKLSAAEIKRNEAVELQARFDAAAAVDPMGARQVVYGEVFDAALAEDADYTFDHYRWTVELLTREAEWAQAKVDEFAKRFATNPVDAFRWGSDAVQASAKVEVIRELLRVLQDHGVDNARAFGLSRFQQAAREAFPRSSSPMANLVEAARAEAWANLVSGCSRASFIFGRNSW